MPSKAGKLLVQVLGKIPIFKGLSPTQTKRILGICTYKSYSAGTELCLSDSPSDEMYILLTGGLSILTNEGVRVATILPVTTVGEMGVITGQPRSATVEASSQSNIFVVNKKVFDKILSQDSEMRSTVYRNIIDVLSAKLNNDNVRMSAYQEEKERFEMRLAESERNLAAQNLRTEAAVNLAAKIGNMTPKEISMQIDGEVRAQGFTPRVLIVDDEVESRHLLKEALASFTVVEADDGKEALEVVQEEEVDLVITGIDMPNMDGFSLLEALRSRYPQLSVLALSNDSDIDEVRASEFDGFFDRAGDVEELCELVEQFAGQKEAKGAG